LSFSNSYSGVKKVHPFPFFLLQVYDMYDYFKIVMKSGSGKSANLVGQSVLGVSKSITCSKVAALLYLITKI